MQRDVGSVLAQENVPSVVLGGFDWVTVILRRFAKVALQANFKIPTKVFRAENVIQASTRGTVGRLRVRRALTGSTLTAQVQHQQKIVSVPTMTTSTQYLCATMLDRSTVFTWSPTDTIESNRQDLSYLLTELL
jgi:hypothetical protein